jgi:hypothetical protein
MTIHMAIAAICPVTLVMIQVSVREMNMMITGHGNNTKTEPMDISVRS